MSKRTPAEILAVIDFAQEILDKDNHNAFDLRALLWEVIEDVADSARLASYNAVAAWKVHIAADDILGVADCVAEEVMTTVNDYVGNHYGDDR